MHTRLPEDYVVVRTVRDRSGRPDTWASVPMTADQAAGEFRHSMTVMCEAGPLYGPHTGNRLRILHVDEWDRVQREAVTS